MIRLLIAIAVFFSAPIMAETNTVLDHENVLSGRGTMTDYTVVYSNLLKKCFLHVTFSGYEEGGVSVIEVDCPEGVKK